MYLLAAFEDIAEEAQKEEKGDAQAAEEAAYLVFINIASYLT
jgi:hypothetical protein